MKAKPAHCLIVSCGVLAIVTGLVYIANLPGLTSDATGTRYDGAGGASRRGMLALWLAVSSNQGRRSREERVGLLMCLGFIFLLQLPPIVAWFAFHGQVINDGPVGPMGHWAWSLPHIVVAAASAGALYLLFFRTRNC
ncbi:MAG: hypothetical protein IMW96_10405 [Thermoanaerobacteraceae bacterium]|nr:hypothetical protein [Thermoanaerobacteraceae bacterium]